MVFLVFLFGCDLVFVENISDSKTTLLSPSNNITLLEGKVNFSWEELEGADSYNLQIATPNFTEEEEIVLDTAITNTSFSKSLILKDYEWRLKAINEEYETEYTTNSFFVVYDVSEEEVMVLNPEDNAELSAGDVLFSWETIEGANSYHIKIVTPDFISTNEVILDTIINMIAFKQNLVIGDYEWRVKAIGNLNESNYKTQDLEVK